MSLRGGSSHQQRSAETAGERGGGCLMELIASTWVDFFHAAFMQRKTLEEENERVRMSAVRRDLDSCYATLQQREVDLQIRAKTLARQAVTYKQGKNLSAARKKMLERARVQAQLDKIQNSILMIDMHRSTIEGTALDITVLKALKASGDVLRQMGATGEAVEGLVAGLEESMQSAAEITTVLSSGSVSGMVNSMAAYGTQIDEEELMRELDDMSLDAEGEAVLASAEASGISSGPFLLKSLQMEGAKNTKLPSPAAEAGVAVKDVKTLEDNNNNKDGSRVDDSEDESMGGMMEMAAVF